MEPGLENTGLARWECGLKCYALHIPLNLLEFPLSVRKTVFLFCMLQEVDGSTAPNLTQALSSGKRVGSEEIEAKAYF